MSKGTPYRKTQSKNRTIRIVQICLIYDKIIKIVVAWRKIWKKKHLKKDILQEK